MPRTRSAIKQARQNQRRSARNRAARTRYRNVLKQVRQLLSGGKVDEARDAYRRATKVIDRAAARGLIHRNTASRTKSRLSRKLNTAGVAGSE